MNFVSCFDLSAYTKNTLMEIKPMNVLIANIGTSDLNIKIDGYYVPIVFLREPGLEEAEAEISDTDEEVIWNERRGFVQNFCEQELEINFEQYKFKNRKKFPFREITKRILNKYQENIELWHKRLQFGRILDVIKAAQEFDVQKIYIFITDQSPTITDRRGEVKENDNFSDSLYLFKILELWLKEELYLNKIHLISYNVTQNDIIAVDFDGLLDRYYQFFLERSQEKIDKLLISVKGGTPQMQTALRIQATASDISNQIYLEPQLSIKNLLAGKQTECNKVSYWRYQRVQKYQTVKKLLTRWDFDGANVILKEWDGILKSLAQSKITGIADSYYRLELALHASEMAVAYFNLDAVAAANCADYALRMTLPKDYRGIVMDREKNPFRVCRSYEPALNLYTRCRIYWQLGQAANFLFCFGSFYEEILHYLFVKLDGDRYFDEDRKPRWSLQSREVVRHNRELLNLFLDREQALKEKVNANFDPNWSYHRLDGRFSKRNFAEALVLYRRPDKQEIWQQIIDSLNRLDYWFDKRNAVTHGAKGISKERLDEILTEDRKKYIPEEADPLQADPNEACWGSEILDEMGKIYRNVEIILDLTPCPFIDRNSPDYNQAPYYIYSEAKEWVIETLDRDR